MYIVLTEKCNMSCGHCCMGATTSGRHMPIGVYRKAVEFASGWGETINLGGGEPTLHPRFWEALGLAISAVEYVWLATNGSRAATALILAKMARSGVIGCALSVDRWHDPIDPAVIEAFKQRPPSYGPGKDGDLREIRNVGTGPLIKAGRCDWGTAGMCPCGDIQIRVDGSVYGCGCPSAPKFGNVTGEVTVPSLWAAYTCYREQPEPMEVSA